MKTNKQNPDYGQEMPGIIITMSILAIVMFILAFWQYHKYLTHINQNLTNSIILASTSILFIFIAIVGIWSSKFGKLILRDIVLSKLNFKGTETVLDLGCGKGLLLIGAAKKIPLGKAIGAGHWVGNLEYKYSAEMVMNNAKIEGVSKQIEVVTADAQALPFMNNSFDIVMTSLMMHHISDTKKALNEMVRVLKPGGNLIIADVNSKQYIPILESIGVSKIEIHYATRLFLVPTYIIKGLKSY
jgi:SAM-dependent methyltransferase